MAATARAAVPRRPYHALDDARRCFAPKDVDPPETARTMTPSCPVRRSPFASRSLAEHLLRGALAVLFGVSAFRFGDRSALIVPAAVVGAVALMRGCPTCWLVGLFGTLSDRASARTDPTMRPAPPSATPPVAPAESRITSPRGA